MKKIKFLAFTICFVWFTLFNQQIYAIEDGAYKVTVNTSYYNPDTNKIDDGGTANAALGEGMCRSATNIEGLVEKSGDECFVTIRLLLQSNTKDVKFYYRTGFDEYEELTYDIIAENGIEDSIDYRFKVKDPFKSIKATMYVTPMGRETLWYILLDEETLSTDTGDFIVSENTDNLSDNDNNDVTINTEVDLKENNIETCEIEKQEVMKQNNDEVTNLNRNTRETKNKIVNKPISIVSGVLLIGLVVFAIINRVKGDK
ncbi:MAG: hypothetical protein N4A63_04000 [Vallitalea sp.]|jgi:hypothetical protein|nr:hypothetical protein [Vallitalea sp.]